MYVCSPTHPWDSTIQPSEASYNPSPSQANKEGTVSSQARIIFRLHKAINSWAFMRRVLGNAHMKAEGRIDRPPAKCKRATLPSLPPSRTPLRISSAFLKAMRYQL